MSSGRKARAVAAGESSLSLRVADLPVAPSQSAAGEKKKRKPSDDGGGASSSTAKPESAKGDPAAAGRGESSAAAGRGESSSAATSGESSSMARSAESDPLEVHLLGRKKEKGFTKGLKSALDFAQKIMTGDNNAYNKTLVRAAVDDTIKSTHHTSDVKLELFKRYRHTNEYECDPEVIFSEGGSPSAAYEPALATLLRHYGRNALFRDAETAKQVARVLIEQGCRLRHAKGDGQTIEQEFPALVEVLELKSIEKSIKGDVSAAGNGGDGADGDSDASSHDEPESRQCAARRNELQKLGGGFTVVNNF